MVGPALIGAVADHAGLRFGICIPLFAAIVVIVLASALRLPR
jgi:hypothetical protein